MSLYSLSNICRTVLQLVLTNLLGPTSHLDMLKHMPLLMQHIIHLIHHIMVIPTTITAVVEQVGTTVPTKKKKSTANTEVYNRIQIVVVVVVKAMVIARRVDLLALLLLWISSVKVGMDPLLHALLVAVVNNLIVGTMIKLVWHQVLSLTVS